MSRLKQIQNIDRLIQNITSITESRCSLSEKDLTILNEALSLLTNLKRKKGKTNEEVLQALVPIFELLVKFFTEDFDS